MVKSGAYFTAWDLAQDGELRVQGGRPLRGKVAAVYCCDEVAKAPMLA